MEASVLEYIDFLYEKLWKLAVEEIQYSDYDQMTDWLGEIKRQVKKLEKKQDPMKPIRTEKSLYCPNCVHWLSWGDAIPNEWDNYCGICGQKIDWED